MADNVGESVPENAQDLTIFVQNLLEQMQGRFNQMSTTIIGRIDEMGNRIDDLEKSIVDLMQQAGVDQAETQNQNGSGVSGNGNGNGNGQHQNQQQNGGR